MAVATILLILQSAYGPPAPVKPPAPALQASVPEGCRPSGTGEIVVCKRRRASDGQRLDNRDPEAVPDQRMNLKLSDKVSLKGGGPMGQKGQSAGVGFKVGF